MLISGTEKGGLIIMTNIDVNTSRTHSYYFMFSKAHFCIFPKTPNAIVCFLASYNKKRAF